MNFWPSMLCGWRHLKNLHCTNTRKWLVLNFKFRKGYIQETKADVFSLLGLNTTVYTCYCSHTLQCLTTSIFWVFNSSCFQRLWNTGDLVLSSLIFHVSLTLEDFSSRKTVLAHRRHISVQTLLFFWL